MKGNLVLCHGFGFDSDYWDHLIPYFSNYQIFNMNLGYYGKKTSSLPPMTSQKTIGIGHSLGFLKLAQLNYEFDLLVGLNPFLNFMGRQKEIRRRRQLEFNMLKSNLKSSPEKTLEDFHMRCGAPFEKAKFEHLSLRDLTQDLDFISYEHPLPKAKEIFLLASEDDPVVPKVITEDLMRPAFSHLKVEFLKTGSHALGCLNPDLVQKKIKGYFDDPI